MVDSFKSELNSIERLCSDDLNSPEIDDFNEDDTSIACGSILLSKRDMNVYFSCFSCEMQLHDFKEFLEHSLQHHFGLKETDLAVILSKMSKKKEKPASTSKADVSDGNTIKVDFLDFEDDSSEDDYKEPDLNVANNVKEMGNFIDKFENFVSHIKSDQISELPSNEHPDDSGSISDEDYAVETDLIEDTVDTTDQKTADFELIIIQPNKSGSDRKAVTKRGGTKLSSKLPTRKDIYDCKLCEKSYRRRDQFILHMKRHCQIKPYACEFCDARFPDTSNWKVHRQRHLGIKPHKCTLCEKSFTSTTELKRHNITHTGERRFPCSECGKLYRTAAQLNYHRRRHNDDRRFVCSTCGKRFYEMQLLRDHEVSHSSERPFECEICEMTFSRNKALREHVKLHSDVKQYACKLCPKTFAQCAGLHSHMKSHLPKKAVTTKSKAQKDV